MKKFFIIIFSFFLCATAILPQYASADEQTDDIQNMVYELWNYVNNSMQSVSEAVEQDRRNQENMDELKEKVDKMDAEKAIKDYFDGVTDTPEQEDEVSVTGTDKTKRIKTGSTANKILSVPKSLAIVTETIWIYIYGTIAMSDPATSAQLKTDNPNLPQAYGIDVTNVKSEGNGGMKNAVDIIRIFAYSLVVLFFSISLIEQTVKYEVFTAKGIMQVFGRLLVAKLIIDLSVDVCLGIVRVIGGLTTKLLGENFMQSMDMFPNVDVKPSDIKIIGPIVDAIVSLVLSLVLLFIVGTMLICSLIVMIKLVLRSIELTMLIVVSPAFFACLSSDVTKQYFRNFISAFIQVASQTIFMAIAMYVCQSYISGNMALEITKLSDLAQAISKIMPTFLVAIAMCVMMVKPPKILTNLVK